MTLKKLFWLTTCGKGYHLQTEVDGHPRVVGRVSPVNVNRVWKANWSAPDGWVWKRFGLDAEAGKRDTLWGAMSALVRSL